MVVGKIEFEISSSLKGLGDKAIEALEQIEVKRYGADLEPKKRLIKVGVVSWQNVQSSM